MKNNEQEVKLGNWDFEEHTGKAANSPDVKPSTFFAKGSLDNLGCEIHLKINIVNKSTNPYPKQAKCGDAGVDIMANLPGGEVVIEPGKRAIIPTGLYMAIPKGFEGQVRPRSGLAVKHGVTVLNSPGTIDSQYRGEIGVVLVNFGDKDFVVKHGDRIAQMVFAQYFAPNFIQSETLDETDRGEGGFGHTGV